jgi:hypothetical protein
MRYLKNQDDGQVHGYDEDDPSQIPHIEDAIAAGWEDVTGHWPPAATPAEILEQRRAQALSQVASLAQQMREMVIGTSDSIEVAAWANKLRIAQAIKAGSASDVEVQAFEKEIALRAIEGETLDTFVDKVLANAERFSVAAAVIDGIKRAARDAIDAASTSEEIDAGVEAMRTAMSGALVHSDAVQPS